MLLAHAYMNLFETKLSFHAKQHCYKLLEIINSQFNSLCVPWKGYAVENIGRILRVLDTAIIWKAFYRTTFTLHLKHFTCSTAIFLSVKIIH